MISHGGICTARCDPGFLASTYSLECLLGEFYPSGFTCIEASYGYDQESQLLSACLTSDSHRVGRVIAMGANVGFKDSSGDTALHLCALHAGVDNIRGLLAAKAPVNAMNARGWTPLHVAASRGHVSIVSEMLVYGADVFLRDDSGSTPGDLARAIARIAPPAFGREVPRSADVVSVLIQAERLRSNQDCQLKHICPSSPQVPILKPETLEGNPNWTNETSVQDVDPENFTNSTQRHYVVDINRSNSTESDALAEKNSTNSSFADRNSSDPSVSNTPEPEPLPEPEPEKELEPEPESEAAKEPEPEPSANITTS